MPGHRVAALIMAAALLATTAAAQPADTIEVDKQLTYTCTHPLVGPQTIPVRIRTTFPDSVRVGGSIQPGEVQLKAAISRDLVRYWRWIGAANLAGTADFGMDAQLGSDTVRINIPDLAFPVLAVPSEGPVTWPFVGAPVKVTPTEPGAVRFDAVSEFDIEVFAYDENGNDTALGNPIPLPCVLATDQDTYLATIPITE